MQKLLNKELIMAKTKNKFNVSYTQTVIERMLGEKGMQEFHDNYCEARYKGDSTGFLREPSKSDLKILKMWQSGLSLSEIHQKTNLTHSKIDTIIKRTAKYVLRFQK